MKNFVKNSCGRSQGVTKIFRAPIHGVHCAVIFAIAQLSGLFSSVSYSTLFVSDGSTVTYGSISLVLTTVLSSIAAPFL